MKKILYSAILLVLTCQIGAVEYVGRVVTVYGEGIGYATVYPLSDPVAGTATNDDGVFRFSTNLPQESIVIISFLGYEKQELPLAALTDSVTIVL